MWYREDVSLQEEPISVVHLSIRPKEATILTTDTSMTPAFLEVVCCCRLFLANYMCVFGLSLYEQLTVVLSGSKLAIFDEAMISFEQKRGMRVSWFWTKQRQPHILRGMTDNSPDPAPENHQLYTGSRSILFSWAHYLLVCSLFLIALAYWFIML